MGVGKLASTIFGDHEGLQCKCEINPLVAVKKNAAKETSAALTG